MGVKIPMRKTERLLSQYLEAMINKGPTQMRRKLLMDHIKNYNRLACWLVNNFNRLDGCSDPTCVVCQDNKKMRALAITLTKQERKP